MRVIIFIFRSNWSKGLLFKGLTSLLTVLILMPTGFAHAHKVIIFAWVEDGMIISQSYFGSKREAKNCDISVVNEKGQVVHKGKTDEKGNFSFKIHENIDSDFILNLDAGSGHQAHWRISAKELKTAPLKSDIKSVMETRKKLEQGPSLYKIIAGISIIFILVFGLAFIKKKSDKKKANKNYD
jgi:hypothetical protein